MVFCMNKLYKPQSVSQLLIGPKRDRVNLLGRWYIVCMADCIIVRMDVED